MRRLGGMGRRQLLGTAAAAAAAAPFVWRPAAAQEKPAELIVRAWGGVWVESLEKGVSKPFT
jgi:putative spermidine/putrescine transport system substrate-binding protein